MSEAAADAVSYVVTIYNKAPFLPSVVQALAAEGGDFAREYIFADDGSTDESVAALHGLESRLPGPLQVLRLENSGAAAATNAAVRVARHKWLRFVDGDDLVTRGSTQRMLDAVRDANLGFAFGELGEYDPAKGAPEEGPRFAAAEELRDGAGLERFIRNCTVNLSGILVARDLYYAAGGCDERMISPDPALFCRLFATSDGVHVRDPVALVPTQAPGRLSSQTRRSRYDSVLSLYYLVTETPNLPRRFVRQAHKRAASRAYTYAVAYGASALFNRHLARYLLSKFHTPRDAGPAIWRALSAFTENGGSDRPESWMPGALKRGAARARIG